MLHTGRGPHTYEVDVMPAERSEPERFHLPAGELPADRDAAVEEILAYYAQRGGEVLGIRYCGDREPDGFLLSTPVWESPRY